MTDILLSKKAKNKNKKKTKKVINGVIIFSSVDNLPLNSILSNRLDI